MHLRFFEAIAAARDIPALQAALHDVSNELDFERFSLIWFHQSAAGIGPGGYVHNAPEAYLEQCTDPELSRADPTYQHITTKTLPLIYDGDTYARSGAGDLYDAQSPFGYKAGIAVTMLINGSRMCFGFDRSEKLPKDADRLAFLVSQAATVAAYAQHSYDLIASPDKLPPGITPERLQILRLIAEGKSDPVIGELCGISKHTVNFHVRKIFEAFGVASRAQAILKAAPYLKLPTIA